MAENESTTGTSSRVLNSSMSVTLSKKEISKDFMIDQIKKSDDILMGDWKEGSDDSREDEQIVEYSDNLRSPEYMKQSVDVIASRLYVGGLPSSTTKNQVKEAFSKVMLVEKHVSSDELNTDLNVHFHVYFKSTDAIQEVLDNKPWHINGVEAVVHELKLEPRKRKQQDETSNEDSEEFNEKSKESANKSAKRKLESQGSIIVDMPQAKRAAGQPSNKNKKVIPKVITDDRPLIQRWNLMVILPRKKAEYSLRDPQIMELLEFLKEFASEININRYLTVICRSETDANMIKDEVNNFEVEGEKIVISEVNRAVKATKIKTVLYPMYVGNTKGITNAQIDPIFPTAVKIKRRTSRGPFSTKRFFCVYFATQEELQRVLKAQPYYVKGKQLDVSNPNKKSEDGFEEVMDEDPATGEVSSENLAQTPGEEESSLQPTIYSYDSAEEHDDPLTDDSLSANNINSENNQTVLSHKVTQSTMKYGEDLHEIHLCLPRSKKSLMNPDIVRLLKILEKAADVKIHREFHVLCPTQAVAEYLKPEIENFVILDQYIEVHTKYKIYREPVVDPKWNALYIGGLPAGTTEDDVMKVFPAAEKVELRNSASKNKNFQNMFCFVYFDKESEVKDAIQSNPWYINGKEVQVDEAKPDIPKKTKFQKKTFKQHSRKKRYSRRPRKYDHFYQDNEHFSRQDNYQYQKPQRNQRSKQKPKSTNKTSLSRYEQFAAYNW